MTPITAPPAVVRTWREEATRAKAASRLPADPRMVDVLRFVPRELGALVAQMGEALSHASGILLASVANATPVAQHCPVPDPDGSPHPCTCGPEGRARCGAEAPTIAAFQHLARRGGAA